LVQSKVSSLSRGTWYNRSNLVELQRTRTRGPGNSKKNNPSLFGHTLEKIKPPKISDLNPTQAPPYSTQSEFEIASAYMTIIANAIQKQPLSKMLIYVNQECSFIFLSRVCTFLVTSLFQGFAYSLDASDTLKKNRKNTPKS